MPKTKVSQEFSDYKVCWDRR